MSRHKIRQAHRCGCGPRSRRHRIRTPVRYLIHATRSAILSSRRKAEARSRCQPGRPGFKNASRMPSGGAAICLRIPRVSSTVKVYKTGAQLPESCAPVLFALRQLQAVFTTTCHNDSITPKAFCTWRSQAHATMGNTAGRIDY